MGDAALVILKCPSVLELQKELTPFRVDEQCRLALGEFHQKMVTAAATMRLRTIATTVTQTTTLVNFLLCMLVVWSRIPRGTVDRWPS